MNSMSTNNQDMLYQSAKSFTMHFGILYNYFWNPKNNAFHDRKTIVITQCTFMNPRFTGYVM